MSLSRRHCSNLVLALVFAILHAGVAWAATNSPVQWPRVSRLIGMKVEDRDGETIGKLCDLAFDPHTSRLCYAIITSGGFLGFGRKLRAVPAPFVSAATAKRDTLAGNFSKTQWQTAPTIRASELPSLGDPSRAREIAAFYNRLQWQNRRHVGTNAPARLGEARALTPTADSRPLAGGQPKMAGDLIGAGVVDPQRERLGEILDLLADLNGPESSGAVWAIVSAGRLFGDPKHDYLVSLSSLRIPVRGKIILEADRVQLEQAGSFPLLAPPPDAGDPPKIFRYYHRD